MELAKAELRRQLRPLFGDPVRLREAFEALLPELVDYFGEIAAAAAAEWFEDVSGMGAMLATSIGRDGLVTRAKAAAQPAFAGNPDQALANLGHAVDELVKQRGRDTVIESSARNGIRFARVPSGPSTCAFCLILASSGYAYTSKSAAGGAAKFHHDCDCQIVPDVGDRPDGYDPDALYEQYRRFAHAGATPSEIAADMRSGLGIK